MDEVFPVLAGVIIGLVVPTVMPSHLRWPALVVLSVASAPWRAGSARAGGQRRIYPDRRRSGPRCLLATWALPRLARSLRARPDNGEVDARERELRRWSPTKSLFSNGDTPQRPTFLVAPERFSVGAQEPINSLRSSDGSALVLQCRWWRRIARSPHHTEASGCLDGYVSLPAH